MSSDQIQNIASRLARNLLAAGNGGEYECKAIQFAGSEFGMNEVHLQLFLQRELEAVLSFRDDDARRAGSAVICKIGGE